MDLNTYIKEFKINNYKHFNEFYKETSKQIYFTALGILNDDNDASDILQDTYISFLNNIDSFKIGTNIYAYLTTIARNKSINLYNKNKKIIHNEEILGYIPDGGSSNNYISDRRAMEIINRLLNRDEREIVIYHVLLDYKFKDIASIMNMKLSTVIWHYNKAMKYLKEGMMSDAQ